MKAPTKPISPRKPYPPNANQKVNIHTLDTGSLFFKKTFIMTDNDDEVEVPESKFIYGRGYIEIESLSPSLSDIMKLAPGISSDRILIRADTMYSEGVQEGDILRSLEVYYTTPFDYKEAMKKYKIDIKKYEQEYAHYKNVLLPQYQKDLSNHKTRKAEASLADKKAKLRLMEVAINSGKYK